MYPWTARAATCSIIPMCYGYATGGDLHRLKELVGAAAAVHVLDPVLNVRMGG